MPERRTGDEMDPTDSPTIWDILHNGPFDSREAKGQVDAPTDHIEHYPSTVTKPREQYDTIHTGHYPHWNFN